MMTFSVKFTDLKQNEKIRFGKEIYRIAKIKKTVPCTITLKNNDFTVSLNMLPDDKMNVVK